MKLIALALLLSTTLAHAAQANGCQATTGATAPVVVELYTSEGCSSCPPADRWLSTLKGRPDVLALAFHVNYWDKLGWPDRFASPEATARQYQLARLDGSSGVYTPQLRAQGQDWRGWPQLPQATSSPLGLSLSREGDMVTAQINPAPGTAQLAGYWAVLEDGHASRVSAGENAGETLRHDHVVRLYRAVPPWVGSAGAKLQLQVSRGEPAFPRRVAFVVTDPSTRRPLQALALAC
jgi:hypothetical protein